MKIAIEELDLPILGVTEVNGLLFNIVMKINELIRSHNEPTT